MAIKLLALDMDGTTLCDDHTTIIDANREAIEAAMRKGIRVVVATGRMRGRVPEQMRRIGGLRYLITSNGAALTDLEEGRTLYTNPVPRDKAGRVYDVLDGFGLYVEAYLGDYAYVERRREGLFESFPLNPGRREMLLLNRVAVESLRGMLDDPRTLPEKINLPYLTPEEHPLVLEALSGIGGIGVTSSVAHNAEVNNGTANKADALSHLCSLLGVAPEETMAMGDGDNDLELLRFAGIAAVPANAWEGAREEADYITRADNNEGAVAEAVRRFLL